MNNNEPPEDFDLPESENKLPQNDDEPQNLFSDSLSDSETDQSFDEDNYRDVGSVENFTGDIGGLPMDWQDNHIPNENDFNNAGARLLRELNEKLNSTDDADKTAQLLEAINETIRATQWLPSLVPQVLEVGLALRSPALKIGRIDLWQDTIYLLFHSILDQLKSDKERGEYFRLIFMNIADLKANMGQKIPERSAINELAREYGMYESGQGRWLLVRAALLNAVILDYSPEKAEYAANNLIHLARRSNDHMTEMRVYLAKSRRYLQDHRNREAFSMSQQALAVATHIEADRFYSDCFASMLASALMILPTSYIEDIFDYWLKLRPFLHDNVYEKAMFFALQGKYLYDRKTDFNLAAQAFKNAYEAEMLQSKALAQAKNLLGWGMSLTKMGEYETAHESYRQALTIYKSADEGEMEVWILYALGWNAKLSGRIEIGIRYLENGLERSLDLLMTPSLEATCKSIKEDLAAYRSSLDEE
ncbi:MAG: tetratricopeptide repeat protein [Chloroflexi bacterium]|nr:tetratricopeptide repeat protein [Chloroflexota bacterium]